MAGFQLPTTASPDLLGLIGSSNARTNGMIADLNSWMNTSRPNYQPLNLPQVTAPTSLGGNTDGKSLMVNVLDALDRGRASIVNPLADLAKNGWSNSHLGQDVLNGLNGTQHSSFQDIIDNTFLKDAPVIGNSLDKVFSWLPMYSGAKWLANQVSPDNVKAKTDVLDKMSVGGFIGDTALDPLTYLTLGAGSLEKQSLKAGLKAAEEHATSNGLNTSINRDSLHTVPDQIYDNTLSKYAGNTTVNPNLVDRLAINNYQKSQQAIQDAMAGSRNTAQNRLFSLDVPFTNISKGFGTKPDFLKVQAPKIGELGTTAVTDKLKELGIDNPLLHQQFAKQAYGVNSIADMTTQQLNHFLDNIGKANVRKLPNDLNVNQFMKTETDPKLKIWEDIQMAGAKSGADIPPAVANRTQLAKWISDRTTEFGSKADLAKLSVSDLRKIIDHPDNKKIIAADGVLKHFQDMGYTVDDIKNGTLPKGVNPETKQMVTEVNGIKPKSVDLVNRMIQDMPKFVADSGGMSKLFAGVKGKNPFNARTLRSDDPFINEMANHIQDAYGKIAGGQRQMAHDMQDAQHAVKDLNQAERDAIPYFIQKSFPDNKTAEEWAAMHNIDLNKVETASAPFQRIFSALGEADKKAGTVPGLRENYFPHVSKLTPDQIDQILRKFGDDKELASLLGRSSSNAFGKKREGYQTLSQVDNYVASLADKLGKETDPAERAALQEKLDTVSGLFERDPITALGKRYYASIRSNAMKELQGTLKERGVIREKGNPPRGNNFVHLSGDQEKIASQLGLNKGSYIHRDILKGLQKTQEIFTDEGMNKFLDTTNKITNMWKSIVTTYSPSHHINNFVGDVANNSAAGVRMSDYGQAKRILSGKNLTDFDKEIYKKAMDEGILGHSWMSDFHHEGNPFNEPKGTLDKMEKATRDNKGTRLVHKFADPINNFTRLALFVHGMKTTGSTKKASEIVRKYLFNYRELTGADRAMRSVVPFWSWMKNNLPMQIAHFARQPRYAIAWNRMREQLNGNDSNMPGWAVNDYMKVPGTDGSYYNPRLPIQDLNRLNPVSNILQGLNPAAKVPIELEMNKQFYNGAPVDLNYHKNGDSYNADALAKYGVNQLGVVGKIANGATNPDAGILESLRNLFLGKIQNF